MSFVLSAWQLTLFLLIIAGAFLYLSSITAKNKKRMVEGKEILFLIGLTYLVLAHFSMFISIGQALDENYQAPCENLVNQSEAVNATTTQYTYYDSCDTRSVPTGSTALVLIFSWLLFAGLFGIFLAIIVFMTNFAKGFF